jgi:hypothetical protein
VREDARDHRVLRHERDDPHLAAAYATRGSRACGMRRSRRDDRCSPPGRPSRCPPRRSRRTGLGLRRAATLATRARGSLGQRGGLQQSPPACPERLRDVSGRARLFYPLSIDLLDPSPGQ